MRSKPTLRVITLRALSCKRRRPPAPAPATLTSFTGTLAAVQAVTFSADKISMCACTPPMSRRGPSLLQLSSGGNRSPMFALSIWE